MRNKRFTHISSHVILALILVLLAGSLVFTVANQANAEGDGANEPETAVAAISSAFTYQGSLENGNGPVNGNCDMQFSLYDVASGDTANSTVTKSSVAVGDGLFAVELDFGDQFTGDARYMQIAVRCPAGSGSYTPLNGRVALTAAPYALSLRPGAVISGTTGTMLTGWSESDSTTAIGLYGYAESSNYAAYGVYGESSRAGSGVGGRSPLPTACTARPVIRPVSLGAFTAKATRPAATAFIPTATPT